VPFATNRSGHEAVRSAYPERAWRFGRDRHSVAAVEFALVALLLIKLYLGLRILDGLAADPASA
jgi:Flp pilus assembly protein TadG